MGASLALLVAVAVSVKPFCKLVLRPVAARGRVLTVPHRAGEKSGSLRCRPKIIPILFDLDGSGDFHCVRNVAIC
ncbi:MAG: hypothetical protein J2P54_20295 [Bradyrhizobiaceae bacterium]|nr:hypothetical protein [Bradyrhizobiaceae bacterium]